MSPTKTKTIAALLIVAALLCGIVIGVAGDRAFTTWRIRHSGSIANRIVHHLDRQLNLTPQQLVAVQQIVERHRQRIDALLASVRPGIRQEIDATNAEIDRVLTPQQREKFRTMRMHMLQREHHMRGHGGPV